MNAGKLRFGSFEMVRLSSALRTRLRLTGAVMNDENRGFGAILVGGRHVNKYLSLCSHRLLLRFECGIVAPEDFAVSQPHRELEVPPFGIAPVREIGIDLVTGTDGKLAVAFWAGILRVRLGCLCGMGEQADEAHGSKTASASRENTFVQHGRLFKTSGTQRYKRKNPKLKRR